MVADLRERGGRWWRRGVGRRSLSERIALRGLGGVDAVVWDGDPVCVRPAATRPPVERLGRFSWDPVAEEVTVDEGLHLLPGVSPDDFPGSAEEFAHAVAPSDTHLVPAALRGTAAGHPPTLPLYLRAADGAQRLMDLRGADDAADDIALLLAARRTTRRA